MRKIGVLIVSLFLVCNNIYAYSCYIEPEAAVTMKSEQLLFDNEKKYVIDTIEKLHNNIKNLMAARQEGKNIIVQIDYNMLIHLERIKDAGDFKTSGIIKDDVIYVNMNRFFDMFQIRVRRYKEENMITLSSYKTKIVITDEKKLAKVNDKEINLEAAPIIISDQCYLPVKCIAKIFDREIAHSYKHNQHVLTIQPIKILQDTCDIKKVLFFKPEQLRNEKNLKPFLALRKQNEIELFAQLINNAEEGIGMLDVLAPPCVAKVYYKDEILFFPLYVSTKYHHGGWYLDPKDSYKGHYIQNDDLSLFLSVYKKYFNQ